MGDDIVVGPMGVLARCTSFDTFVMTLVGMLKSLVLLVDGGRRFDSNGFLIAFGPGCVVANAWTLFVVLALVDDGGYKLNGNDCPIADELPAYDGKYLAKLY